MAVAIDFFANVSRLLRGVRQGTEALEDVADTLDDLARTGKDVGEKIGDGLGDGVRDGARTAEPALERVERSFKELADTAKAESRKAGDDLGDKVRGGARRAGEGVEEMGSEIKQEMREAGASFGGVEDALDSIQSIASNAFAGFGPAGLVAGAAVAVAFGTMVANGEAAAEVLEKNKERIGELANELYEVDGDITRIDLGGKMREWGVEIADSKEFWEIWQESAVSNLDKAEAAADRFKVSSKDMFLAFSGLDAQASDRVLSQLRAQLDRLNAQVKENARENPFAGFSDNAALDFQRTAIQNQIRELESMTGVTEEAAEANRLMTDYTSDLTDATQAQADAERAAADAAAEATRVREAAAGSLQSGLNSAISDYARFKATEDDAINPQGYIDAMTARVQATADWSGNVSRLAEEFGLSQAEVQAILDQGVDFAPMLQSIVDSGLAPQFVEQIKKAVGGGQELLDGTPLGTTLDVDADLTKAENKTKATEDKPRAAQPVKVDADTNPADVKIGVLTGREYRATVTVDAAVSAARAQINSLDGRRITVYADVVDRKTGERIP